MDENKLNELVGKVIGDFGSTLTAGLAVVGDRLGLFRAMKDGAAITPAELARKTGIAERYAREWLLHMGCAGYIEYAADAKTYRLSPEQTLAFADESSPAFMIGGYQVVVAMLKAEQRLAKAYLSGEGMAWSEHDPILFQGTERFFRPGYVMNLVGSWLPALQGVTDKLAAGGSVADIGCGHGASTIVMAKAYPKSRFIGFDAHGPSIEKARAAAAEAGVGDRVRFEVGSAAAFPGKDYDLVCYFDSLHDMGQAVEALAHSRSTLADGGTILLVEPMAGEKTEDNFNPIGRVFTGASCLCCTPNAVASGRTHLGTVAPESALRAVASEAGFTHFRRATETVTNRVFELRK